MAKALRLELTAALAIAGLLVCGVSGAAGNYLVVINSANPVTSLGRRDVSAFFLRRTSQWENGTPAQPVDGPDAPARESFSKDVHGRKTAAIKSHWLQVIFSGRGVPPPAKASDEEVIAYVKAHRGGIGYVAATADTREVKLLEVEP